MSEIDCERFVESLYLLLDGELDPELCAKLELHMARCSGCLGRHDIERRFKELVHRTCGEQVAPAALLARIHVVLQVESGLDG